MSIAWTWWTAVGGNCGWNLWTSMLTVTAPQTLSWELRVWRKATYGMSVKYGLS